jgi:hypothetical protein
MSLNKKLIKQPDSDIIEEKINLAIMKDIATIYNVKSRVNFRRYYSDILAVIALIIIVYIW